MSLENNKILANIIIHLRYVCEINTAVYIKHRYKANDHG